jgi:hypothetical protein
LEYVEIAVRLGIDVNWRDAIIQGMISGYPRLYSDVRCVAALEEFLRAVVHKKLRAQHLASAEPVISIWEDCEVEPTARKIALGDRTDFQHRELAKRAEAAYLKIVNCTDESPRRSQSMYSVTAFLMMDPPVDWKVVSFT